MRKAVLLTVMVLLGVSAVAPSAMAQSPDSGQRGEILRNFNDAADKALRLAERIPEDKYTWRPTSDVRSFSELFLHIAGGNYSIPRRVGRQAPEGFNPQSFDKSTTKKADVINHLKKSIENVRAAVNGLSEPDLEKTAPWFGGAQRSYREILFFLASHNHEHLGQAIAYTRVAGLVPPWTEEQQQRPPATPKK